MHENDFEMFSVCFKYIENFETWNHLFHEFHSFMFLKMLIPTYDTTSQAALRLATTKRRKKQIIIKVALICLS